MVSSGEVMQLIESLIWLLAGVGVFIVGMNFMGDALEKSAGSGMKRLLKKSVIIVFQVSELARV